MVGGVTPLAAAWRWKSSDGSVDTGTVVPSARISSGWLEQKGA
jgi:hypothetical protein